MARFQRFEIYHHARDVLRNVHAVSAGFAGYAALKDQMRRASISVVSNIAEGAEHGSDAEFRRFLVIAKASCGEIQAQLEIAADCALLNVTTAQRLAESIELLARRIGALIRRLGGSA